MNKGLYHVVFNPQGTKKASDNKFWYDTTVSFTSVADCFNPSKLLTASGYIASGVSGRPDGKYYDIAYSDGGVDVREYAKILTPYEVDFITTDKEENGVEEIQSFRMTNNVVDNVSGASFRDTDWSQVPYGTTYQEHELKFLVFNKTTGVPKFCKVVDTLGRLAAIDGSTFVSDTNEIQVFSSNKWDNIDNESWGVSLSSNTSLSIDLIGNPTNYPQIMKDRLASGVGVVGINPHLVGQDGSDYLQETYTIRSDKVVSMFNTIRFDYGVIYDVYTPSQMNFDAINNHIYTTGQSGRLYMTPYTSKNLPYTQTTPKPVIDVEPKAIASNSHSVYKGALIGNQVAGKIQVGNGANGYESKVLENVEIAPHEVYDPSTNTNYYQNLTTVYVDNPYTSNGTSGHTYLRIGASVLATTLDFSVTTNWLDLGKGYAIGTTPQHSTIALDNSNSPASKWFKVLEQGDNGVLAGVYGKEMVWDYTADNGGSDFIDITEATLPVTSLTIGNRYHITDGLLEGYYTYEAPSVDVLLSDTRWYLDADGNIKWHSADIVVFRRWDGNGFGDNDKFDQLTNSTKTDLNGKTVKTFHGSIAINGEIK